ncbi:MAG TPA: CHAT domain-containing protein [Thermoanaerobaculia bacterium]|nr:CHAT domain-containing protein [Thermoanaerobaculia bacterium]
MTIDSVRGYGESSDVRATIVRTPSPLVLQMKFRRDGDTWRLTECVPAARAAARDIVADPARFDALLYDDPELLGRDLAYALASYATVGSASAAVPQARPAAAALNKLAALRGDAVTRALAATAEAVLSEGSGDMARAKARADEALALARTANDAEAIVRALVIRSRVSERSPNGNAQALAAMEEALPFTGRMTNRLLAAYVVGNTGNLKLKQGRYAEALTDFQRAAAISKEIDDVAGLMKTESAEGLILQIEGNDQLAIAHMLRAIELGAGDPRNDAWRGQTFISLTQSYMALGRDREAMEALRNAEEFGRRSKAPIVIGEAHRLLGSTARRRGDYATATREIEQALTVFREAKRIHFIPGAMSELALTRLEAGDPRGALEHAGRCAAASLETEEVIPFIECRTFSGEAHRALGDADAALADFREAVDASEERRRTLVGDARQRAHFLERVISPYLDAAGILAERGDVAAALELAEQAKSRSLLDILASDVSHRQTALTPQEQQRDDELSSRIAALNRRRRDEKNKPGAEQLARELAAARNEYESYQLALDVAHPRRGAHLGSVPIAKPRDVLPLLGASAAIVEYIVNGEDIRAFVVASRGGAPHLQSFRLRGGRDLDARVARFGDALANADLAYRNDAASLYAQLLQPLEPALRGAKTLCIVPDGALWRLPFEALLDRKGRFVAESRACFYAPSMSVLAQAARATGRKDAPTTLLAVGQPFVEGAAAEHFRGKLRDASLAPIKEAADEVRALRSLYGAAHSRIYIGRDATKENVMSNMESSRVLHFATHAVFDEENPMYSEVVLAESPDRHDDGLMAAWEIMHMNLRADVAVLSACDTARGRISAGEGVIGFTWALFVAGCPSSVVSEWKVDSASTKKLMVAFHRSLLQRRGPVARAEALRAAKLSLLRDPNTRHPFYWAPFVLVGSPGTRR